METKQKTWEECCDEVAQKYGWGMFKNIIINGDFRSNPGLSKILKEAAELFNQETAKERDSYKSGAEQWKATSKYQENEINKLREERDALQKELADTQINLSTVEEENERLKELSDRWGTELLKLYEEDAMSYTQEVLSLIEKAKSNQP